MCPLRSSGAPALISVVFAGAILMSSSPAAAGGYELTSPAARPNGRGGANYAGADSPMGLFYNPATMARLRGYHIDGSLHMHFSERCMQRVEVIEDMDGRSAGTTFPNVCSGGPIGTMPQLGFTAELAEGLTLGAGVFSPPAAFREVHYGDPDTVTIGQDEMEDPIFSPTRYLFIESKQLQVFPTVGLAYEPHPQLRLGASFAWGITSVTFATAAYSEVAGGVVTADARNELEFVDAFVPRVHLGAWARPVRDFPLELGLSYRWQDNVRTDGGELSIEGFNASIESEAEGEASGVGVRIPQTSELAFGMRYAHELDQPEAPYGDRLSSELFDVEAALVLTFNNRVDDYHVDIPDDATITVTEPLEMEVDLPDELLLAQRWKTQVGVRVGGDYNVVPGVFAVRGGFSFESQGVEKGYEQLNFQPWRRVGLHLGATVRIANRVDLSATYAHIFQPDRTVSVQDAQYRRAAGGDATEEDASIQNAGTFTANYDVLILGASARF
ncbi:MAG: OmpP1/FadL family transporter [Myxococcota bacterium]